MTVANGVSLALGVVLAVVVSGCAGSRVSAPPADLQSVLERADRDDWGLRMTAADGGHAIGRVSALSSASVTLGDQTFHLADLTLVERERDRSGPLLIGIVAGTLSGLLGGGLYSAVTETSTSPTFLVGSALVGLGIGAIVAEKSQVEWEKVWAGRGLRRERP